MVLWPHGLISVRASILAALPMRRSWHKRKVKKKENTASVQSSRRDSGKIRKHCGAATLLGPARVGLSSSRMHPNNRLVRTPGTARHVSLYVSGRLRTAGTLALISMRIFNAKHGDPMLLDTRDGLRTIHRELIKFLESGASEHARQAQTSGSPAPYDEFLKGLRIKRSEKESRLCFGADGWLELSGKDADLVAFSNKLLLQEDGVHNHWYGTPVSLIIQADDEWTGSNES
jgi:hypothetical protein